MLKLMLKPQSLTSIDRTCVFFLNSCLLVKTLCSRVLMVRCQFLDCFFWWKPCLFHPCSWPKVSRFVSMSSLFPSHLADLVGGPIPRDLIRGVGSLPGLGEKSHLLEDSWWFSVPQKMTKMVYEEWLSGWRLTYPSEEYEFVSWDDDIPNWMEPYKNVPNHQPAMNMWSLYYAG